MQNENAGHLLKELLRVLRCDGGEGVALKQGRGLSKQLHKDGFTDHMLMKPVLITV